MKFLKSKKEHITVFYFNLIMDILSVCHTEVRYHINMHFGLKIPKEQNYINLVWIILK